MKEVEAVREVSILSFLKVLLLIYTNESKQAFASTKQTSTQFLSNIYIYFSLYSFTCSCDFYMSIIFIRDLRCIRKKFRNYTWLGVFSRK